MEGEEAALRVRVEGLRFSESRMFWRVLGSGFRVLDLAGLCWVGALNLKLQIMNPEA